MAELREPAATNANNGQGIRLISRILPPAVRLWIQSQLDHVEELEFSLDGKDRQILSGYVPQVRLTATKAVYTGLHLSQVQAAAAEIRFNLGQMVRGKPLRLLQSFPVRGQVCLYAEDLLASLHSSLLSDGLQDVLLQLVKAQPALFPEDSPVRELIADFSRASATTTIFLNPDQLTLNWNPAPPSSEALTLVTGLQIKEGHLLWLVQPQVWVTPGNGSPAAAPIDLDDFVIDLGQEVDIKTLAVGQDRVEIEGMVNVIPGD